jgi:hypothetical protein
MRSSMLPGWIPEIVMPHGQGQVLWAFLTCSMKDISEQEQVRSALVDMLAPVNTQPADEMDEAALMVTIEGG